MFLPPRQLNVIGSCCGQPKGVVLMVVNWPLLIRNCEGRKMGSNPTSKNGAMATGPAMVMRYSTFPNTLISPPGNVIWSTGMGIVYWLFVPAGRLGFLGTIEPSGFRSATVLEVGKKATGEMERMSKPRISFS